MSLLVGDRPSVDVFVSVSSIGMNGLPRSTHESNVGISTMMESCQSRPTHGALSSSPYVVRLHANAERGLFLSASQDPFDL